MKIFVGEMVRRVSLRKDEKTFAAPESGTGEGKKKKKNKSKKK